MTDSDGLGMVRGMTTSDVQAGFLSSPQVSYHVLDLGDGSAQLLKRTSVDGTVSEHLVGPTAPLAVVMDEAAFWTADAERSAGVS